MSDLRGQSHDPTDFYSVDLGALPLAVPADKPKPDVPFFQGFSASVYSDAYAETAAAGEGEAVDKAYAPIVAELQRRGINAGVYTHRNARDGWDLSYDEDAIWTGINAARATDAKAFPGVPKSAKELRDAAVAPFRARTQQTQETADNAGWGGWLLGKFWYGATDPINQVAMLAGAGEAKTIAEAIARDAAINARITAAEQPVLAFERHQRGQTLSPIEAAENVLGAAALGGVTGGTIKGTGKLLSPLASRLRTPAGDAAAAMRETVGPENMTDAERAAAHVLDRADEVAQTSPFTPGAGTEEHAARVELAQHALATGKPILDAPAIPLANARETVMARIARAENATGSPTARNPNSSATGKYQFTDGTWLRYYKREIGAGAQTDAQILAHRSEGAVQDRLMRALTDDNAAALHRLGVPETAGNLYLEHFAGQGGAEKILRADPEAPIEGLLKPEAINANPFLKGKTASEVIAWAHAKMGEKPHSGPVLRREIFGSDDEFRAAQAALDAEEQASARVRAEQRPSPDEAAPDPIPQRAAIDPAQEPHAWDLVPSDNPVESREVSPASRRAIQGYISDTNKPLKPEQIAKSLNIDPTEARRALAGLAERPDGGVKAVGEGYRRAPVQRTPDDLMRFLAKRGGIADNEGHALIEGRNLQKTVPGVGKVIRQGGMPLDRAREAAAEAGYFHDQSPVDAMSDTTTADFLDLLEKAHSAPHYALADVLTAGDLARERDLKAELEALKAHIDNHALDTGRVLSRRQLIDAAEHVRKAGLDIADAVNRVAPDAEALKRFDNAMTGLGPASMIESMEHDLRMDLVTDPDRTMQLDAAGGEVRIADVLEDLDHDREALAAARRCMAPGL